MFSIGHLIIDPLVNIGDTMNLPDTFQSSLDMMGFWFPILIDIGIILAIVFFFISLIKKRG